MITPLHPFENTSLAFVHGPYQVLAQRDVVTLSDGSVLHLHPVAAAGHRLTFHRSAQNFGQWRVFDLRHLCPGIENDILALPTQDTPGVVLYSLRCRFATAQDVWAAIAATMPHAESQEQFTPKFKAA
jgi:hypothetical protein